MVDPEGIRECRVNDFAESADSVLDAAIVQPVGCGTGVLRRALLVGALSLMPGLTTPPSGGPEPTSELAG
jgi:hypothetical protein